MKARDRVAPGRPPSACSRKRRHTLQQLAHQQTKSSTRTAREETALGNFQINAAHQSRQTFRTAVLGFASAQRQIQNARALGRKHATVLHGLHATAVAALLNAANRGFQGNFAYRKKALLKGHSKQNQIRQALSEKCPSTNVGDIHQHHAVAAAHVRRGHGQFTRGLEILRVHLIIK